MPLYLAQVTLNEVVARLAVSSISSSLADYLIFKRALKIAQDLAKEAGSLEPSSVVTGTKSAPFMHAIEELTLRVPREMLHEDTKNPYYVPFGSMRDNTRGYRTRKFPSNGSPDTVGRWQSRSKVPPLTLVPGTSPKEYSIENRSKRELEDFFVVGSAAESFSDVRPRLLDSAVW